MCPECGGKLLEEGEDFLVCEDCGELFLREELDVDDWEYWTRRF